MSLYHDDYTHRFFIHSVHLSFINKYLTNALQSVLLVIYYNGRFQFNVDLFPSILTFSTAYLDLFSILKKKVGI